MRAEYQNLRPSDVARHGDLAWTERVQRHITEDVFFKAEFIKHDWFELNRGKMPSMLRVLFLGDLAKDEVFYGSLMGKKHKGEVERERLRQFRIMVRREEEEVQMLDDDDLAS